MNLGGRLPKGETGCAVYGRFAIKLGINNIREGSLGADDVDSSSDLIGSGRLDLSLGHGGVLMDVLEQPVIM